MGWAVPRLLEVVAQLREHCLWTAALTHNSLIEYLVEEAHELAEDMPNLKANWPTCCIKWCCTPVCRKNGRNSILMTWPQNWRPS